MSSNCVRVKIWCTTVYSFKSKALNSAQRLGFPSTETAAAVPQVDFSQQVELMYYRNIKYLGWTFFFDTSLYFYPTYYFYIFLTIFLGQFQLEDRFSSCNYIIFLEDSPVVLSRWDFLLSFPSAWSCTAGERRKLDTNVLKCVY